MSELDDTFLANKKNQVDRSRNEVWGRMLKGNSFTPKGPDEPVKPDQPESSTLMEPPKESWLRALLKETWEGTKALPETVATMATGTVAWPISKIGGAAMTVTKGAEEGKAFEDFLAEHYTYQPKQKAAEAQTGAIAKPFEVATAPARWIGDVYSKLTGSPEGGHLLTITLEGATLLMLPKVGKTAKQAVVKPKPFEGPIRAADIAKAEAEMKAGIVPEPPATGTAIKGGTPLAEDLAARQKAGVSEAPAQTVMEDLNARAHDEIQAALEKIPPEEWAKIQESGKSIDMQDMAGVIRRGIDRLEDAAKEDVKLPDVYKKVIEKEKADLQARADNLEALAKEAEGQGQELIVVPQVLTPKAEPPLEMPMKKGYQGAPVIIGEKPSPELAKWVEETKKVSELGGAVEQAWGKPGFLRSAEEIALLSRNGLITPARSIADVARDFKTILDLNERGALGDLGILGPDKIEAYVRLKKDFQVITRNAARVSKSVENYLLDLGIDRELVAYMVRESQANKEAEMPPGMEPTAMPKPPPGEAQPKPSPGVPPEAVPADVRINLDRIIADDAVKAVVAELDSRVGATPAMERHRAVQSHEKTIAKAERMTVSQLLKMPDTTKDLAPVGLALRDEVNRAATRVTELQTLAEAGDFQARQQVIPMSLIAGELIRRDEIAGRNIARALEARKIGSEEVRAKLDYSGLADLAEAYRNAQNIDPDIFIQRLRGLIGPEEKATFFKQLVSGLKKGTDIFSFAFINGLLSGLPTHVVNFASNAATFLGAVIEREAAATIGQAGRLWGREPGVSFGEGGQMLYGVVDGFMDAARAAKKSWIENEPQFGPQKTEIVRNPLSREYLGTSGAFGQALEFIGNVIGGPGRAMMTADEFMKAINYRAELKARAFREAKLEGLSGQQFGERIKYIIDNPEEFEGIHNAARGFALEQTFNAEVGQIGRGVMNIANATPITKVILPFVRTPTNIIKYSQARTPVLNMVSKRFWEDLGKGGADAELALGKMATGVMAVAAVMVLADSGLITGSGPTDKKLKKVWLESKQPYSVKINDKWIAYDRMDPWGNVVGAAAEATNLINDLDLETGYQVFSAIALAASNIYVNKTYLKGANDFITAVRSPDQGAENYIRQWARSLTPAAFRTVNRAFFDDQVREVNSIMDALKAGMPGFSEDLPPKRGFWGQPIIPEGSLGPDVLSPYRVTSDKKDPVNEEILRNRMSLSMPLKVLGGYKPSENPLVMEKNSWGVKLDPKQYDRFVELARAEPIINGQTAKEAIGELINRTSYDRQSDGPEGGKALMIREVLQNYEKMAVMKLREEFPDLAKQIDDRRKGRIEALRPGAEPEKKEMGQGRFLKSLFQ